MNRIVKHGLRLGIVALLVGACVSAKVSEPSVCDTQTVSWNMPNLPSIPTQYQSVLSCSQYSAQVPSASTSVQFNFADSINKVSKVASNLNVNIDRLTINSPNLPLDWVQGVQVWVPGTEDSGGNPQLLATYSMPEGGANDGTLDVKVVMSPDQILNTLESGPVQLNINLMSGTGTACDVEALLNAGSTLNGTVHMCVSASGDFNKSL